MIKGGRNLAVHYYIIENSHSLFFDQCHTVTLDRFSMFWIWILVNNPARAR